MVFFLSYAQVTHSLYSNFECNLKYLMKENICFKSLEIFGEIFKFGIINILS